jgi:hypothetical protein
MWIGLPLLAAGVLASFLTDGWWPSLVTFVGFLGVFQARAGTCVALAARGAMHMDTQAQPLQNPAEVVFFRNRARGIYARTLIATLALLLVSRVWLQLNRTQ